MDRTVEEALDTLIDAILETDEFEKYQDAKSELSRDPNLKLQVDEFRRRNFDLQQSNLDSKRLMEEIDRFEKEYETFRANPVVHRFLSSELAFTRLMQHVYGSIMENIDFE